MPTLKIITDQLGADSAALMVPSIRERHNYCHDSYNMPPEWVAIKNDFDEDVPGGNVEVYKTGKPAITNGLKQMLEGYWLESVMIVPVIRSDQVIAMLELVHSAKGKTFSNQDLDAAQEFTKQLERELP